MALLIRRRLLAGAAWAAVFGRGARAASPADAMTYGTLYGFADLNPFNRIGHSINYMLFDALTVIDPASRQPVPSLAQSWTRVAPDTVEFTLRPGVTFSDGTQLTAEDVKFSFDTVLTEKLPIASIVATVDHVEAAGPLTVRVVTKGPDPIIDKRVSLVFVVPKAAYGATGTKGFGLKPVGTGQYVASRLIPNASLVAEAAPAPWRGAPATRKVTWTVFTDPNAFLAATQAGQLDVAQALPPVALNGIPGYKVESVPVGSPFVLALDTTKPPFDDVRVRQALNMSVDRAAVIRVIQNGAGSLMSGQLPGPDCFGHNPGVTDYKFDLPGARDLMAQAGHADGFATELAGQESARALLEALSGQFAKLKVAAKVTVLPYSTWVESFYRGSTYPMFLKGLDYAPLFDAEQSYQWVTVGQPGRRAWMDATWETSLARSRAETDVEKRRKVLQDMAQYLHDQAPFLFLFGQNWPVARRTGVTGLDLTEGKWIDAAKASLPA